MKILRTKKTIFIEAESAAQFDQLVNDSWKNLVDPSLQIYGLYKGAITYTSIVIEEESKTVADLFEENGCGAKCGECPLYKAPADGRKKWTVCGNRKINEKSKACDAFYLERRKNVSTFGGKAEGVGLERCGSGCVSESVASGCLQQETRTDESLTA